MRQFLRSSVLICVSGLTALLTSSVALAEDDEPQTPGSRLNAGLAYDFSKGDYGGTTTIKSWTTTANIEYEHGDFLLALSLPHVRQYGPLDTIVIRGRPVLVRGVPVRRQGRIVIGPASTATVYGTATGIGDVRASASYFSGGETEGSPLFDARLNVKFGTGDKDKGLGTGKNDYGVQGTVSQAFGSWNVSGSVGYTVVGKIAEASLRNYFNGSTDLSNKIDDESKIGLRYGYTQASSSGNPSAQDLTLYYSYSPTKQTQLQIYFLDGLTTGSADRGAGLSLTMSF